MTSLGTRIAEEIAALEDEADELEYEDESDSLWTSCPVPTMTDLVRAHILRRRVDKLRALQRDYARFLVQSAVGATEPEPKVRDRLGEHEAAFECLRDADAPSPVPRCGCCGGAAARQGLEGVWLCEFDYWHTVDASIAAD